MGGGGPNRVRRPSGKDNFRGVTDIFTILTVVISWVYAYVKTYQIVHSNYVEFMCGNYTSIKLFLKGP